MTEHWGPPSVEPDEPRASLIVLAPDGIELWMGGTHSLLGEPITLAELSSAFVVDCSGELPETYRENAAGYLPRVFLDIETVPAAYPRLAALVHDLVGRVAYAPEGGPLRIYVLCQQGMNRSGLVAGMLLRALGYDSVEAIDSIRRRRPGALSNETFVRLVEEWSCPRPESAADAR